MGLTLLGIFTLIFFVLAGTNGLKRVIRHPAVKAIAKKHRLFGVLAATTALAHMIVAVAGDHLRLSGLIALLGVIATAILGTAVFKLKQKRMLLIHRIIGPLTFVSIIIHMIIN